MTTVSSLQTELAKWETARDAILEGAQSYTINGRSVTRANLEFIQRKIDDINARIDRLNSGGRGVISPILPSLRG